MLGVFCDAKYRPGVATIAVLRFAGGEPEVFTKCIEATGSSWAECAAIDYAMALYPDEEIFNDCQGACLNRGATWIPREMNKPAHQAAAIAFRNLLGTVITKRKKHKGKNIAKNRRKRKKGRGVLPVGEINRLAWA